MRCNKKNAKFGLIHYRVEIVLGGTFNKCKISLSCDKNKNRHCEYDHLLLVGLLDNALMQHYIFVYLLFFSSF